MWCMDRQMPENIVMNDGPRVFFFLSLHGSYSMLYWSSRPTVVILQCVRCLSVKATNPPPPKSGAGKAVSPGTVVFGSQYYSTNTWFTYHRRYTKFANDSASLNTYSYHRRPFSSILTKFNNTNTCADNSPPPSPLSTKAIPYSLSSWRAGLRATDRVLLSYCICADMISS